MGAELVDLLWARLPEMAAAALRETVAEAGAEGVALALAGGAVRDLLLGAAHLDVDLVVEGDAIALAQRAGRRLGARVVTHPRFGTAAVRSAEVRLDLAPARSERYARPGALPSVEPAALADDLGRRDFTINAMALRLSGPRAGELVDPHGGRDDLRRCLVRVLHDESFRDDATRLLRALRYAGRLRFRLAPETETLLRSDLAFVDTISGARIRHELERIADEERVSEIISAAACLGVLAAVHPALQVGDRELRALARLDGVAASHRDAVLLAVLLASAPAAPVDAAVRRLALTGRQAEAVRGLRELLRRERTRARVSLRPSEATEVFDAYAVPAVEGFALLAERALAAERAQRYLSDWRHVRPRLNGRDVEALGVAHGPAVGQALAALREARLDGVARAREDEVALVRERFVAAGARRG